MYKVVINGFEVSCETTAELLRLTQDATAATDGGTVRQPATSAPAQDQPPHPAQRTPPADIAAEPPSKWTGPAKTVIALLAEAGDGGVDADQVAKTAGLKGSKGSAPLLRAIAALLGDKRAVARPRAGVDGKKRWVLTTKGTRAAAKLGLIQQG
jgi:hypothetical protein